MKFEDFIGISKFSVSSWCFYMINHIISKIISNNSNVFINTVDKSRAGDSEDDSLHLGARLGVTCSECRDECIAKKYCK